MRPNLFQIPLSRWLTAPFRFRSDPRIPIPTITTVSQRRTMKTLIEREIISTEIVKPSSPTPHHLQSYKLSMLDQINPPSLIPIVLYFSNNKNPHTPDHQTATELLKRSLSVILTRFYPLAGQINDDIQSVSCNDQGVPFTVAKIANGHLSDLLKSPDMKLARHLLPYEFAWDAFLGPGSSTAMIQLTRFECGSFAIGTVFWHRMMDAITASHFLKCWANTSLIGLGYKEPVCPNYTAQSLFPRNLEALGLDISLESMYKRGKSIMRRYVFDPNAISYLKSKISNLHRPSRVEVVSALIWRCFMAASLANKKSKTIVILPVNLRRRAQPPFPSDSFGNFLLPSVAWCNNNICSNDENNNNTLGELAEKIRTSMREIDGEYVDRMVGDGGFSGLMENMRRTWTGIDGEGADFLDIASYCNSGLYEMDFGWGKPTKITLCDDVNKDEKSAFLNIAWLNDSSSGDGGVEAWVTLDEKYMEIFDTTLEKIMRATAYKDISQSTIV